MSVDPLMKLSGSAYAVGPQMSPGRAPCYLSLIVNQIYEANRHTKKFSKTKPRMLNIFFCENYLATWQIQLTQMVQQDLHF